MSKDEAKYHKIMTDHRDNKNLFDELISKGAIPLVEYDGGIQVVWKMSDEVLTYLQAGSSKDIVIERDVDAVSLAGQLVIPRNGVPEVPTNLRQTRSEDYQFWLVQYIGPEKREWLEEILATGAKFKGRYGGSVTRFWLNGEQLRAIEEIGRKKGFLQWTGAFHPYYRVSPFLHKYLNVSANDPEIVKMNFIFHNNPKINTSLARLRELSGVNVNALDRGYIQSIIVPLPIRHLVEIANLPDLVFIEPYYEESQHDEAQAQVIAGNTTG